jgi:hypothetical protein
MSPADLHIRQVFVDRGEEKGNNEK